MTDDLRFAHGDAYAMVGDYLVAVLGAGERARVPDVWDLVDSGSGIEAAIDVIVADGISGLGDIGLIELHEGWARVLVRGTAQAIVRTSSDEYVVSPRRGTFWTEEVFSDVTGVRLDLGAGERADTVLNPGLTRAGAVEVGDFSQEPAVEESVDEDQPLDIPATGAETESGSETEAESAPATGTWSAPQFEARLESASPSGAELPPAEAGSGHDEDHDGLTMMGKAPTGFERPVIPGQEHAPPVVARPVAALHFSTGEVVGVDRPVLVGRAPEARQFSAEDQPVTVTVPSPQQEISATHLEIRPGAGVDHGSAIVTDLGSTNGTVLNQPGLGAEHLQPGIAVSLIPGAVLDLGDGITIQVGNP